MNKQNETYIKYAKIKRKVLKQLSDNMKDKNKKNWKQYVNMFQK